MDKRLWCEEISGRQSPDLNLIECLWDKFNGNWARSNISTWSPKRELSKLSVITSLNLEKKLKTCSRKGFDKYPNKSLCFKNRISILCKKQWPNSFVTTFIFKNVIKRMQINNLLSWLTGFWPLLSVVLLTCLFLQLHVFIFFYWSYSVVKQMWCSKPYLFLKFKWKKLK